MDPPDRVYLERACELARRAAGSTAPNPAVGALVVRDGNIVSEGYHHRAGEAHAEVNALRAAGERARGATLYVTLEPCSHHGRTPPCSHAVAAAGIVRVVAGTRDPNPATDGAGIRYLRDRGIVVEVAEDPDAVRIVEPFARAVRAQRPYLALKMAMSLDGYVASKPGTQEWLTGAQARELARELRIAHDAVVVGAGTVRVDDPRLTVRPPHRRAREYVRIVACETDAVNPESAVFASEDGYAKTIVLAPAGARTRFSPLHTVADVVFVGADDETQLDLPAALRAVRERGITSVVCEGGPTMAANLLAADLVDRFYWLIAPRLLHAPGAVPVLGAGPMRRMPDFASIGSRRWARMRSCRERSNAMFSGLIAYRGHVQRLVPLPGGGARLRVRCEGASDEDVEAKDSIAINGVCLTAAAVDHNEIEFDVVPETLSRSNLGTLHEGDIVNVEYSLRMGDRLGGHFVYGHVDAAAQVLARAAEGQGERMRIALAPELARYVCEKAFVSIDGVSVTVASTGPGWFELALIPETLARTTLGARNRGDYVNIEIDPLARYAVHAAV